MDNFWSSLSSAANVVSDSALKLADDIMEQVNEAEKHLENEQRALMNDRSISKSNPISNGLSNQKGDLLPWETSCEVSSILSQDLMEQILALSEHESNFLEKPNNALLDSQPFDFNTYVPVILKVLEIDYNLQRLHAKLVPKIKGGEETFWRNYYLRILYIRACVGIDTVENDAQLLILEGEELAACEERVRVTKLIAKIPPSDVLFVDKVILPIPISAGSVHNSSVEKVDKDEAATELVPTPKTDIKDSSTSASTKEGVKATLYPINTSRSRSDKELEDEIEAELNECEADRPVVKYTNANSISNSTITKMNGTCKSHSAVASTTPGAFLKEKDSEHESMSAPAPVSVDDLDDLELELELEGLDGDYDELDELDELEDMILDEIEEEGEQFTGTGVDSKPRSMESSGILVGGDATSISSGSLI